MSIYQDDPLRIEKKQVMDALGKLPTEILQELEFIKTGDAIILPRSLVRKIIWEYKCSTR